MPVHICLCVDCLGLVAIPLMERYGPAVALLTLDAGLQVVSLQAEVVDGARFMTLKNVPCT